MEREKDWELRRQWEGGRTLFSRRIRRKIGEKQKGAIRTDLVYSYFQIAYYIGM